MATPKWCFLRNKMIDSYFWGSSNENIPKHRLNFSSMAGCHQHLPNHFWVTLILKPNHSKQGWVAFPTHNWWIVWKLSVARKMIDMLPIPEGRGWIFLVRKVGISKQTRIQPNLWSFKNITHEKNMTSLTLPATIFFILLHFNHQIPVFVVGCNYFLPPPHQHRDVVKKKRCVWLQSSPHTSSKCLTCWTNSWSTAGVTWRFPNMVGFPNNHGVFSY